MKLFVASVLVVLQISFCLLVLNISTSSYNITMYLKSSIVTTKLLYET